MALMDGGINIKNPVSGIAMGLIINDEGDFAVLSDILGDEDHLGDMDFKVTGTANGITACQMDIKVDGLPYEVLTKALSQAKEGRMHILGEMMKTISEPASDMKDNAPRIEAIKIPGDMSGAIIGTGGKVIQEMQKETETTISIEETEDGKHGMVQVMATNGPSMKEAMRRINLIVNPPQAEIGETYKGKIKSIQSYGCFVEIIPGTDGLIHISEFNWDRIEKMEDVCKEGDVVEFKVVSKDPKTKKFKLSRKILLPKPERLEKKEETKA
jgi:polyribonucleotide nucleotidyltransferase